MTNSSKKKKKAGLQNNFWPQFSVNGCNHISIKMLAWADGQEMAAQVDLQNWGLLSVSYSAVFCVVVWSVVFAWDQTSNLSHTI